MEAALPVSKCRGIERGTDKETSAEVLMRSDGLHSLVDELDDREERMVADG